MNSIQKCLILVFLTALVIDKGSAVDVQCYVCTSATIGGSDTCSEPTSNTLMDTCDGECSTISTFAASSVTLIVRSCSILCTESDILVAGTGATTGCCSTALCNDDDSSTLVSNADGGGDDECYSCNWPAGGDDCLSPNSNTDTCSSSTCSTLATYNDGALTTLTRLCNPVCFEADLTAGGIRTATTCCTDGMCNDAVYSDVGHVMMSLAALMSSLIVSIYFVSP